MFIMEVYTVQTILLLLWQKQSLNEKFSSSFHAFRLNCVDSFWPFFVLAMVFSSTNILFQLHCCTLRNVSKIWVEMEIFVNIQITSLSFWELYILGRSRVWVNLMKLFSSLCSYKAFSQQCTWQKNRQEWIIIASIINKELILQQLIAVW